MSFLYRAAKYTKDNLKHQKEAWAFIESRLASSTIERFKELYRQPEEQPKTNLQAKHPITQKVLSRILELGIKLEKPKKGYRVYIVGIRGVDSNLKYIGNKLDRWDDVVGSLRVHHDGKVQLLGPYRATTDSGRHYTVNRLNPAGAANVPLDTIQYKIWKRGKHKTQNNCMVQIGNEVSVVRDSNANGERNSNEPIQKGWFGINFHSTSARVPSSIGRWSAGCLVTQQPIHKDKVVNDWRKSYDYLHGSDKRCSYILLDGKKCHL